MGFLLRNFSHNYMENTHLGPQGRVGTNPFVTVMVFGTVIGGLVFSGSYFSKQRSIARDLEASLAAPVSAIVTGR